MAGIERYHVNSNECNAWEESEWIPISKNLNGTSKENVTPSTPDWGRHIHEFMNVITAQQQNHHLLQTRGNAGNSRINGLQPLTTWHRRGIVSLPRQASPPENVACKAGSQWWLITSRRSGLPGIAQHCSAYLPTRSASAEVPSEHLQPPRQGRGKFEPRSPIRSCRKWNFQNRTVSPLR